MSTVETEDEDLLGEDSEEFTVGEEIEETALEELLEEVSTVETEETALEDNSLNGIDIVEAEQGLLEEEFEPEGEDEEIVPDSLYKPTYGLGSFQNLSVQKYTDKLVQLLDKYKIEHVAVSESNDGVFIFDNAIEFGQQFIIDQNDPLFSEVLSKGNVLSLSGDLTKSEYLKHIIPSNVLETFSELFIRPVLDNDRKVQGITLLAREKGREPLKQAERQELFLNRY